MPDVVGNLLSRAGIYGLGFSTNNMTESVETLLKTICNLSHDYVPVPLPAKPSCRKFGVTGSRIIILSRRFV